jgi:hypothetical protein
MTWRTRLDHLRLAAMAGPGLLRQPAHRHLLGEMRRLCRRLPELMKQPLPLAMAQLGQEEEAMGLLPDETTTRRLADLAALLERSSPLGLCLRRSLLRYHYLRRLRLPLVVRFGAKLTDAEETKELTGHAWLTLDDQPYHEPAANWRDYAIMVSWPGATPKGEE